jgi:NodT family efflux transporter outer membrane factor (OMF) lipoprotein
LGRHATKARELYALLYFVMEIFLQERVVLDGFQVSPLPAITIDPQGPVWAARVRRTGWHFPRSSALLLATFVASCSVGPDYFKPAARVPVYYKELKGWKPATPRDAFDRGAWWSVYKDKTLDGLERQIDISNQNLKSAEAGYRLAVALIKEAQAGLFPTVNGDYSGVRSHQGMTVSGGGRKTTINTFTLEAMASWDLDVWGRVRRQIESNVSAAQASNADLANIRLLAQAQLATAYFDLRATDSLHHLLSETAADYQRTLVITQNQYTAGTAARSDVDTALAQLKTTQAMAIATGVQRAQYEHAIAALIGKVPAEVSLQVADLATTIPVAAPRLPSTLLERRPDISAAERAMQQQNALIGVQAAAFYPDITLSGVFGALGRRALPLTAANEIWSFGGSATQILFDGGLHLADVAAATATYDQSVATYRQTVLTAFQQVEDQLAALRILAQQASVQNEAVVAARQAVDITLNEYRQGTVSFTTVVTAQATLLGDQETALTIRQNRYLASVALVQALGGGWKAADLPSAEQLKAVPTPPTSSPNLSSSVFTLKPHL